MSVTVWQPLVPADRWRMMSPAQRRKAVQGAWAPILRQQAADGWWVAMRNRAVTVRVGWVPGYRKPWAYLIVPAREWEARR